MIKEQRVKALDTQDLKAKVTFDKKPLPANDSVVIELIKEWEYLRNGHNHD